MRKPYLLLTILVVIPTMVLGDEFDDSKDESKFNQCMINMIESPTAKANHVKPTDKITVRGRIKLAAIPQDKNLFIVCKLFDDSGVEITGQSPKADKEGRYTVEFDKLGEDWPPGYCWICVYVIAANMDQKQYLGKDPVAKKRPYDVQPIYISSDPSTQPKNADKPKWMKEAEEADAKSIK